MIQYTIYSWNHIDAHIKLQFDKKKTNEWTKLLLFRYLFEYNNTIQLILNDSSNTYDKQTHIQIVYTFT